jgi:hypothetical protein
MVRLGNKKMVAIAADADFAAACGSGRTIMSVRRAGSGTAQPAALGRSVFVLSGQSIDDFL